MFLYSSVVAHCVKDWGFKPKEHILVKCIIMLYLFIKGLLWPKMKKESHVIIPKKKSADSLSRVFSNSWYRAGSGYCEHLTHGQPVPGDPVWHFGKTLWKSCSTGHQPALPPLGTGDEGYGVWPRGAGSTWGCKHGVGLHNPPYLLRGFKTKNQSCDFWDWGPITCCHYSLSLQWLFKAWLLFVVFFCVQKQQWSSCSHVQMLLYLGSNFNERCVV